MDILLSLIGDPDEEMLKSLSYVLQCKYDEYAFRNRRGDPDVYYTSFGLRLLKMLDNLEKVDNEKCAEYTLTYYNRKVRSGDLTLSDVVSIIVVLDILGMQKSVIELGIDKRILEFKTANGFVSFSKASPTIYDTFLAVYGLSVVNKIDILPDEIISHIFKFYKNGGFCKSSKSKKPSTNPTSAGIFTLFILDKLELINRSKVSTFLRDMEQGGGFKSMVTSPISDLLSTHTAVVSLILLQTNFDVNKCRQFVLSCRKSCKGYSSNPIDSICDLEYTYYGVATLGLLKHQ
jgi:geranylgeranyl transferase type-2 subunit beta